MARRKTDLDSRLPMIAAEMLPLVETAVRSGAELIARQAKVPVASGELRDAIHVDETEDGHMVVAGDDDVFYGHLVENGTTITPPRPFLVPAAEASREEVVAGIAAALRKAV